MDFPFSFRRHSFAFIYRFFCIRFSWQDNHRTSIFTVCMRLFFVFTIYLRFNFARVCVFVVFFALLFFFCSHDSTRWSLLALLSMSSLNMFFFNSLLVAVVRLLSFVSKVLICDDKCVHWKFFMIRHITPVKFDGRFLLIEKLKSSKRSTFNAFVL